MERGGGRGGYRVLPLLGDGDAVGEEAEGLRAPEGGEVVLDVSSTVEVGGWSIGEPSSVSSKNPRLVRLERVEKTMPERGLLLSWEFFEVCESSNRWGYGATQLVAAKAQGFEVCESSNRWGYGATQLIFVEVKEFQGREGPDLHRYGT